MSTISNGALTTTAEVLPSALSRNLHREALAVNAAAPMIQSGTPGLLSGQLTYLADTLAAALALDAIYSGTAAVTLSGSNPTEQRRNAANVPCPVSTVGWYTNNGGLYVASYDAAAGRRAGTGARKFTRQAASPSASLASAYSAGSADWTVAARVPVTPGEVWTLSAYSKASVAFTSAVTAAFFDASGAAVGAQIPGDPVAGAAGAWVRPSVTVTAPAGATNLGIVRQEANKPSGTSAGGELVWMCDALIERGAFLGDYFDGGYAPTPDVVPSWVGAANASPSILTSTDLPTGLTGLKHVAVGTVRMTAERPVPGRRSKWLVVVEIVEVP